MRTGTSIPDRRVLFRMGKWPSEAAPETTFASVHWPFDGRQELNAGNIRWQGRIAGFELKSSGMSGG